MTYRVCHVWTDKNCNLARILKPVDCSHRQRGTPSLPVIYYTLRHLIHYLHRWFCNSGHMNSYRIRIILSCNLSDHGQHRGPETSQKSTSSYPLKKQVLLYILSAPEPHLQRSEAGDLLNRKNNVMCLTLEWLLSMRKAPTYATKFNRLREQPKVTLLIYLTCGTCLKPHK